MSIRPMRESLSLADLRPGDIGFGPLSGAARLAMWGQFILGEGFSIGKLNIGHVFVVTSAAQITQLSAPDLHVGASAVEAMPRGARSVHFGMDRWNSDYAYVRLSEDYPGQASDAAAIARAMIGTPYSFASYAALSAWRLGWKTPRLEKWIDRRRPPTEVVMHTGIPKGQTADIALPAEAICSVLADQAWSLTGKKIMRDVAHQCVTPGALAGQLMRMAAGGGAVWSFPE